jgi:WD40-like Beta Propeller Repeat
MAVSLRSTLGPRAAPTSSMVRADGGQLRRVNTGVSDSSTPIWSIDRQWLIFAATVGGAERIFKIPVEGGAATQITTGEGRTPRVSSDGRRIYYHRLREVGIWSVSTGGGDERRLSGLPRVPIEFRATWALSASGVYSSILRHDPASTFSTSRAGKLRASWTSRAGRRRIQLWRFHRTDGAFSTRRSTASPATSCSSTTSADPP